MDMKSSFTSIWGSQDTAKPWGLRNMIQVPCLQDEIIIQLLDSNSLHTLCVVSQ